MNKRALFAAVAALSLVAGAASADVIYSNDFEAGLATGFTGATTVETAPSGQMFLGQLTQGETATLTVDTTGYAGATLSFDLYTIQSLDGDFSPGPDYFRVLLNGSTWLIDNTFSNNGGWCQSYPTPCSAGGTGADPDLTGSLGYLFTTYGVDHTYHFTFDLGPAGVNTVAFIGAADQSAADEGFGIDNVVVTGAPPGGGAAAVPEPGTWALMLLGFGGAGVVLRTRRTISIPA